MEKKVFQRQHPSLRANIVSFMEQYVFYYQINWDRKRPKHLTSLSERPRLPVTQIPLNCIHSSISIPDKEGNYIDSGGKSQNFSLSPSEIYRNQSILGREAKIKLGSFSLDLIESATTMKMGQVLTNERLLSENVTNERAA